MRTEKEMYQVILDNAKKLPQVLAVGLDGSRTNPNAPKDDFQDYDIVYVVNDLESLVADETWLEEFGERLIMQKPEAMKLFEPDLGGRFSYLMLFEDGNRIDLVLCPLSKVDDWLKEDQLVKILYDPAHILPQLSSPTDEDHWVKRPDQQEFEDCCNEFWWVSTYVVKGICRDELLYAADHLYEICQKELLRMYSWLAADKENYQVSTGKNYKYLFKDSLEGEEFYRLLDFTSIKRITVSLLKTQELFQQVAQRYAGKRGFRYDQKTATAVMTYTQKMLGS